MRSLQDYFLYVTVFITGAVVLIIEILGTRVLAPFYGTTIFVWSSLISVTLGALALGYFFGGYLADKRPQKKLLYGIIFLAGLLTSLLVKVSEPVLLFSDAFGFQWGPLVATSVLFTLPLCLFGMVTPFAVRLRVLSLEHTGHVAGTIFAVATVGSVLGAILAGFYFMPNFFFPTVFLVVGATSMAVGVLGLLLERVHGKMILGSLLLGIVVLSASPA
ncbi:MAG: fused MFS/spermidine synthase, partial [bacterium]|nr:fused MFS/spermidine synthase [bacterium]